MTHYERLPTDFPENRSSDILQLRVLLREKVHEVRLSPHNTVSMLKSSVQTKTGIDRERQRLIYAGKVLGPDSAKLSSLGIMNDSSIHLFPTQEVAHMSPAGVSSSSSSSTNSSSIGNDSSRNLLSEYSRLSIGSTSEASRTQQGTNSGNISTDIESGDATEDLEGGSTLFQISDIHFDTSVMNHARKINVWSSCLLVISLFCLINDLISFMVTGHVGVNIFDGFININNLISSLLSMYIANHGILCSRSMNATYVRIYMEIFEMIACYCCSSRLLWALDVLLYARSRRNDISSHGDGDVVGHDDVLNSIDPSHSISYNPSYHDSNSSSEERKAADMFFQAELIQVASITFVVFICWYLLYQRVKVFYNAISAFNVAHSNNSMFGSSRGNSSRDHQVEESSNDLSAGHLDR